MLLSPDAPVFVGRIRSPNLSTRGNDPVPALSDGLYVTRRPRVIAQQPTEFRDSPGQDFLPDHDAGPDAPQKLNPSEDPAGLGAQHHQEVHQLRFDVVSPGRSGKAIGGRLDAPFTQLEGLPGGGR
jgi:hypothetical protein